MTAPSAPSFPLSPQQGSPMSFSGRGREFLGMLIAGSLFQIPTFGFYRFWLTTKLRRHLWSNTQIEGEAFEYTGTAKELLIGFLIAVAVLAPLYITYFIITFMIEEKAAFASVPLVLLMYVLAHFGAYRARKYRATRTVFRGVRFWMKGSGWAYAGRAILWDVATVLTLGLALPWAMASLERYRMRNTYFGSVRGDFDGTGWGLFKRGWWIWALGIVGLVGSVVAAAAVSDAYLDNSQNIPGLAPLLIILVVMLLIPLAMAIFTRWHIAGVRFGDVVVSNGLKAGSFYGLFFKLLFSSISFVILVAVVLWGTAHVFSPFVEQAIDDIHAKNITGGAITFFIIGTVVYLLVLLGLGVLQRYFFGRGLWAAVVTTTTVSNLKSIDAAIAAGQPSGMLGEGLADALDFNVGI